MVSREHFIVSSENLRRAAFSIVARIEDSNGSISEDNVFTELVKACSDELQYGDGFLRRTNSSGEKGGKVLNFDQLKVRSELAEMEAKKEAPSPTGGVTALAKARLLKLAKRWQEDKYQNYNDRTDFFVFHGVGIYEFELVCIADLLEAAKCGNPPLYVDSAYRLLRDWRGKGRNPYDLFSGLMEYQMDELIYKLSYCVPVNPSTQIDMILDIWAHRKFESVDDLGGPEQIWIDLLQELGWTEDRAS